MKFLWIDHDPTVTLKFDKAQPDSVMEDHPTLEVCNVYWGEYTVYSQAAFCTKWKSISELIQWITPAAMCKINSAKKCEQCSFLICVQGKKGIPLNAHRKRKSRELPGGVFHIWVALLRPPCSPWCEWWPRTPSGNDWNRITIIKISPKYNTCNTHTPSPLVITWMGGKNTKSYLQEGILKAFEQTWGSGVY